MTKAKQKKVDRVLMLDKALELLKKANNGAGLDAASDAIARAHDAVLIALRTLEQN